MMSIDTLQERIRKLKNPSVIDFNLLPEHIPSHIQERDTFFPVAYEYFCTELLHGMKDIVPGARFSLSNMALYGADGLNALKNVLEAAKNDGYYVLLDCPEAYSAQDAIRTAKRLLLQESQFVFDGLVMGAYIGSDAIRPVADVLSKTDKDLFVLVRTPNRSASELQDLLTGSRHVHMAAADLVNRFAETPTGKCGYSQVAAVMAANHTDSLRNVRNKHKSVFLLIDGYDQTNANAKNCSHAFDSLGHGAAACAGISVTAAWQTCAAESRSFVPFAVEAAERMKKNLTRYVTIL